MWTNVFKIGGLQQLTWFQFLPDESDLSGSPLVSGGGGRGEGGERDGKVITAHVQLQNNGFLTAWTNSFVGPWDPSQGFHNPDDKIKLWLFLPGRLSSIPDTAQHALSSLRVLASGLWLSPGDSQEVAIALSHALRNRLQRALVGLSYLRFGDVFSRYRPFSQTDELFRKAQPTIEFVFAATEEAIFVHAIFSAKHVRTLSGTDMDKVLRLSSNSPGQKLPVIVSPHGMRGSVTGCCSSEFVKQVFIGSESSNSGLVGLPDSVPQASGGKPQGRNCFIEVSLGCTISGSEKGNSLNSDLKMPNHRTPDAPSCSLSNEKGSTGNAPVCEKTFVYPSEAVLVPVLQTSYSRSCLKRFWMQSWTGLSLASSTLFMYCDLNADNVDDSWSESNGIFRRGFHSSSNSNTSSMSSSSSDSDCITKATSGDLEGDADSLCGRQSGMSSVEPMDTNVPKQARCSSFTICWLLICCCVAQLAFIGYPWHSTI